MFSGSKQIAVDRRASLRSIVFEQLVMMKSAWGPDLYDMAAWNSLQKEEVDCSDFMELLVDDTEGKGWDKEMEQDFDDDF